MTYSNGLSQSAPVTSQSAAPDPEVRKTRRKYSSKFKLKTLDHIDTLEPSAVAAYLRKEGLYASMVRRWRDSREEGSLGSPKAAPNEQQVGTTNLSLRRKVVQLEKRLEQAKVIMDVQKKLLSLFDCPEENVSSR